MKKLSILCLLAGLAIVPASYAKSHGQDARPEGPGAQGPDSLQMKEMQQMAELRRDVAQKRQAYFDAVANKKDESSKKAELQQALNKLRAQQDRQLEAAAQRFAKMPRDTARELRRDVARTRMDYFKAVADKKDVEAKKSAYFDALDQQTAYAKSHAEADAEHFAKAPESGKDGKHMRRPGPQGMTGPQEQAPQGQPQANAGMPPCPGPMMADGHDFEGGFDGDFE